MVSSIVLPILSLSSPNLSLNGNADFLSHSSSHLDLGSGSYLSPGKTKIRTIRYPKKSLWSVWNPSQAPLPYVHKLYKFTKQTESSLSAESTLLQQTQHGMPIIKWQEWRFKDFSLWQWHNLNAQHIRMLQDSAEEAPEAQPALAAEAADQEGDMALLEQSHSA